MPPLPPKRATYETQPPPPPQVPRIPRPAVMQKWEPKGIFVQDAVDEKRIEKVQAKCLGAFGVHVSRDEDKEGWFVLTHIGSGQYVVRLPSEEDCFVVGEYLWRKHCLVFREKSKDDVVRATPVPVKQWLKQMTEKGDYVAPPSAP